MDKENMKITAVFAAFLLALAAAAYVAHERQGEAFEQACNAVGGDAVYTGREYVCLR